MACRAANDNARASTKVILPEMAKVGSAREGGPPCALCCAGCKSTPAQQFQGVTEERVSFEESIAIGPG
jgi:hypothetical protein